MGFRFNDHKDLEGKHAMFSASGYHWLNYDKQTFINRYFSSFSAGLGTAIHELAHDCIMNRTKLTKHDVHLVDYIMYKNFIPTECYDANEVLDTLIPFVNDAIGFRMASEVVLFYNKYFFGTADAIKYDDFEQTLRVHDLKTGSTPVKMEQLYIYCAEFCLEYGIDPRKLKNIETRVYQLGEVVVDNPPGTHIYEIMELIKNRTEIIIELQGR